jgi:hypothetical protein
MQYPVKVDTRTDGVKPFQQTNRMPVDFGVGNSLKNQPNLKQMLRHIDYWL